MCTTVSLSLYVFASFPQSMFMVPVSTVCFVLFVVHIIKYLHLHAPRFTIPDRSIGLTMHAAVFFFLWLVITLGEE